MQTNSEAEATTKPAELTSDQVKGLLQAAIDDPDQNYLNVQPALECLRELETGKWNEAALNEIQDLAFSAHVQYQEHDCGIGKRLVIRGQTGENMRFFHVALEAEALKQKAGVEVEVPVSGTPGFSEIGIELGEYIAGDRSYADLDLDAMAEVLEEGTLSTERRQAIRDLAIRASLLSQKRDDKTLMHTLFRFDGFEEVAVTAHRGLMTLAGELKNESAAGTTTSAIVKQAREESASGDSGKREE